MQIHQRLHSSSNLPSTTKAGLDDILPLLRGRVKCLTGDKNKMFGRLYSSDPPYPLLSAPLGSMCCVVWDVLFSACPVIILTLTAGLCPVEINSSPARPRHYCQWWWWWWWWWWWFPSWKYKVQDYREQIENRQIKGHTWGGIYAEIISIFTTLVSRSCCWW